MPTPGRRRRAIVAAVTWTPAQIRGVIVLLAVVLIVLVARAARDSAHIPDPQPARPDRFDELADRIDPNTAALEDLVALPNLGEKRAKAIVEYREEWASRHPGERAFKGPFDLVGVRGIGASMVETLSPHLTFGK